MLRYNTPTAPRVEPPRTGGYGVTWPVGIPQSRQASGSGTAPGPFLMRHGEIVTTPRSAARPSATARAPDIPVGPTVEDFVDAVVAHPLLEVNDPVDAEVGGYDGRFLTLTAPSDISDCDSWRPWEPGIYAQGPDNIWNLWIIDVDGLRMVLLGQEFSGTPAENKAELRAMVESIRFVP